MIRDENWDSCAVRVCESFGGVGTGIPPRCGRIVVEDGVLRRIDRLWLPRRTSLPRVWFDSFVSRDGRHDCCQLTYRGTRSMPGFLAVDYLRSGPRTRFASVRGALAVLDEIARRRQSVAIVAHVSTSAISDRALKRFGWEPHSARLSGRHWIKRFYEGYSEGDWLR